MISEISKKTKSREQRIEKDVRLLKTFFGRKEELRNAEKIPPAKLNELLR